MNALLSARDIEIRFGGVVAADGVALDVFEGDNLAIIGPNGAGKTTFLNICTGYLKPQAGRVTFKGRELLGSSPRAITRLGIARAFQIPQLFAEQTVLENMLLASASRAGRLGMFTRLADISQRGDAEAILEQVGCSDVKDRVASELPEGKRKLVDIALALALKPAVLLMDEPTSGVASSEKFAIMDTLIGALRAQKVTSVFVEHDMEMVSRYANRVAVWSAGRIQKEGPPDEVLTDPEVIRTVIGS
ncbi:ABC transporter ATP-binding protein [Mesorhizobium sp. YIM 152430]|uniref:ABC transporter ATP-binding protein n=1 Tax=Mesorhizobium sp. YIM 152430 TaxID=3031761 RepID=UPI0023DC7343|nr:ABC transporter ATP-binding protein [Mesorhizobium sp. YIM 152430]MDF1600723.1 ABC transporter ATP-binding protein [Mesorhizobium sp. YIM 152430]